MAQFKKNHPLTAFTACDHPVLQCSLNMPKHLMELFSFINQSHWFNSWQIDRYCLHWFFKSYILEKNNLQKMEVLQISGSWDQEIDLWFMNRKTLIPSLQALQEKKYYWTLKCLIRGYSAEGNSLGHGGKFPFLVKAGSKSLYVKIWGLLTWAIFKEVVSY